MALPNLRAAELRFIGNPHRSRSVVATDRPPAVIVSAHNLRAFAIVSSMEIRARSLGWAGVELTAGDTSILIDPLDDAEPRPRLVLTPSRAIHHRASR